MQQHKLYLSDDEMNTQKISWIAENTRTLHSAHDRQLADLANVDDFP